MYSLLKASNTPNIIDTVGRNWLSYDSCEVAISELAIGQSVTNQEVDNQHLLIMQTETVENRMVALHAD